MKSIKLTNEQKEQMSYADVAYLILQNRGKKITIADLFKEVIKVMGLPETIFESKVGDFFGLLSTDKRFIMLEKGFWDLRENHSTKVVIETEFDEEDEEIILEEEVINPEEEDEEEINYDDEDTVDDDDDEDDLKDLVIMDEGEEGDMM